MIQQQAGKIELAVERVGGRNLLIGTGTPLSIIGEKRTNQTTIIGKLSDYAKKIGKSTTVAFSCNWEATNPVSGWFIIQTGAYYKDVSQMIKLNSTTKSGVLTGTYTIPEKDVNEWNSKMAWVHIRMDDVPATTTIKIWNAMFEFAEESADWSPALEDIVGSSLRLEENKIYLGSNNIVLDGDTIAQAIEARSLDVGKGNFTVSNEGIIYAKGATIEGTIKTAESGERIVLSKENNSISIMDEKGSTKVLIKPTNIIPINDLSVETGVIKSDWGKESFGEIRISQNNSSINKTYQSNVINLPVGYKYDIDIPWINISIGTSIPLREDGDFWASGSVYLMSVDGSSTQKIGEVFTTYGQASSNIGGKGIIAGIDGGKYYIEVRLWLRYYYPDFLYNMAIDFRLGKDSQIVGYPLQQYTEIGLNGIMSVWSGSKYFHMTSEKLEILYGSYGLRISEKGLEKCDKGNWTKL